MTDGSSCTTRRRRFLALLALFPSVRVLANDKATGSNAPVVKDIGSWRVIASGNTSRAVVRHAAIAVASHAIETDDGTLLGGSAELKLGYWSAPGVRHGHHGALLVFRSGDSRIANVTAHVFVDDREVDAFPLDTSEQRNALQLLGGQVSGLDRTRELRVDLSGAGRVFTIYRAALEGTSRAVDEMTKVPDHNYHVIGLREAADKAVDAKVPQNDPPLHTGCFITTACCEQLGRPDDCAELRALRRFRDEVMLNCSQGRADVARYYRLAPRIVAAIHERAEEHVLTRLYFTHILPSAIAARLGLHGAAYAIYASGMRRMARRFVPAASIDPAITARNAFGGGP